MSQTWRRYNYSVAVFRTTKFYVSAFMRIPSRMAFSGFYSLRIRSTLTSHLDFLVRLVLSMVLDIISFKTRYNSEVPGGSRDSHISVRAAANLQKIQKHNFAR